MKKLSFSWNGVGSLAEELHKPIIHISTEKVGVDATIGVILWHQDGTGVCCRSIMHDIAPRTELGVLSFSTVNMSNSKNPEGFLETNGSFESPLEVLKLTIVAGEIIAESGVIIQSRDHHLMIVCGAMPYSLAIAGSFIPNAKFDPEYPISEYEKTRI